MGDSDRTTAAVQLYLNDLGAAGDTSAAEPLVRAVLGRAVGRLHGLCAAMLHRQYARLTHGPTNLSSDEVLSAVIERLIRAMRQVRPTTVREFFALANRHMRWELNDLARRLDEQARPVGVSDTLPAPDTGDAVGETSSLTDSPGVRRILAAIEALPDEEREVFNLVRVQGMSHPEAAAVIGCAEKTVQRRLSRGLVLLAERLDDLRRPTADDAEAG